MLGIIAELVSEQVSRGVKAGVAPLGSYMKMVVSGAVLMLLSVFAFALMLLFLSTALFFSLSPDLGGYTPAMLWVSLIHAVLGVILLLFGLKMLRRPR